jgi:hypothetical protein
MKACANCGKEIKESYYMVGDNFLQIKYFDEEDGSDNIFCSRDCLCEVLTVLEIELEEEMK